MKRLFCLLSALIFISTLVACGGGGGDDDGGDGEGPSSAITISGVAAAGAPIVGLVNVRGANGATASAPIEADGSYTLNVDALTPAYILFAEGTVNGRSVKIYSAAVEEGNINITPVTDYIVRQAAGAAIEEVVSGWSTSQLSSEELAAATVRVKAQLAPVLAATGVAADFDPMTGAFEADGSGFDQALDSIDIAIDAEGTTVTVTNTVTESSFTDDVTTPRDDNDAALPDSDETDTAAGLTDIESINALFDILEVLYATQAPDAAAINAQFAGLIADDFIEEGEDKADTLDGWLTGDGPGIGATFTATIDSRIPIDELPSEYSNGYKVRVRYQDDSDDSEFFITNMVFNDTNWLWWGDRTWINFAGEPFSWIDNQGIIRSRFDTWNEDDQNYAYDQGARSMIVSGPGFPTNCVFSHAFPENRFYADSNCDEVYLTAQQIAAIPDNAEYTVQLFAEESDVVDGDTDTPLHTYTYINPKPPVDPALLTTNSFAILTSSTTQTLDDVTIPGVWDISWTNPTQAVFGWARVTWQSNANGDWLCLDDEEDERGKNSANFDSQGMAAPDANSTVELWIGIHDIYGRHFGRSFQFSGDSGSVDPPTLSFTETMLVGIQTVYIQYDADDDEEANWPNGTTQEEITVSHSGGSAYTLSFVKSYFNADDEFLSSEGPYLLDTTLTSAGTLTAIFTDPDDGFDYELTWTLQDNNITSLVVNGEEVDPTPGGTNGSWQDTWYLNTPPAGWLSTLTVEFTEQILAGIQTVYVQYDADDDEEANWPNGTTQEEITVSHNGGSAYTLSFVKSYFNADDEFLSSEGPYLLDTTLTSAGTLTAIFTDPDDGFDYELTWTLQDNNITSLVVNGEEVDPTPGGTNGSWQDTWYLNTPPAGWLQ